MTELEALRESIKKWESIAFNGEIDRGPNNCELCQQFSDDCTACPVFKKTGYLCCADTPYDEWCKHFHKQHEYEEKKVSCDTCRELAIKELQFLQDLYAEVAAKKKEEWVEMKWYIKYNGRDVVIYSDDDRKFNLYTLREVEKCWYWDELPCVPYLVKMEHNAKEGIRIFRKDR